MGYEWRYDEHRAWHHVMNQGTGGIDLFRDATDRRTFITLLATTASRYEVEVHAYALMGNHYHLLVRSRAGRLSDAMQWFGSTYAKGFNLRHGRVGALFRRRFLSKFVDSEPYLRWLPIYIHLNPVRAGFAQRPGDWEWSSYNALADGRPTDFLTVCADTGLTEPADVIQTTEHYAGVAGPHRLMEPDRIWRSWSTDPSLDPPLEPSLVDAAVSSQWVIPPSLLRDNTARQRPVALARSVAVALAIEWTDLSRAQVAARYAIANARGAESAQLRGNAHLAARPELRRDILLSVGTSASRAA